jgi:DNA-binding response OmpR family regulator
MLGITRSKKLLWGDGVQDKLLIVVVEDEAMVRLELEAILEDAGFRVEAFGRGAAAIEALDRLGDSVDGLVTDIRLGSGPSGWDVARHARSLVAGAAVVYVSGDSAGDWTAMGVPDSVMISKPYVPAQIVAAFTQQLNRSSAE